MVAQLKAGMSKDQVRSTLGTPLLIDIFHGERWTTFTRASCRTARASSASWWCFFEDGKLLRVDGDVVPAGAGR